MNAQTALSKIQTELKAPKNMYNSFGEYKYRNFEGICEAVKPMLKETGMTLTVTDSMENIGERYYVKATAVLKSLEDGSEVSVEALAREQDKKKGMDEAQITGAASSYARKYCLNGLFLIDDTKDPDSNESHIESEARAKREKKEQKKVEDEPVLIPTEQDKESVATTEQLEQIEKMCKRDKIAPQYIAQKHGKTNLDELTRMQAYSVVNAWKNVRAKYEEEMGIPFK